MLNRSLWFSEADQRTTCSQDELVERRAPTVVLGDPGMGKSTLLTWLGTFPSHAYVTARQLANSSNPNTLFEAANVLVVDALDEMFAANEGDAVNRVLACLSRLGNPAFVLSCRASDWSRSGGEAAIKEQYGVSPCVAHIEPLSLEQAHEFLSGKVGEARAHELIEHLRRHGLNALLGVPQTLVLLAELPAGEPLPHSRSALFDVACRNLADERNQSKVALHRPIPAVLDAAGGACAVLLLTGVEEIATTRRTRTDCILADLNVLPHTGEIQAAINSRLFVAIGDGRFTYCHRTIAEYLAARYLAKCATTAVQRARLLTVFQQFGHVPASLRGLHAWLAADSNLRTAVTAADPVAVIEHADVSDLTASEASALLKALERVAAADPFFRGWWLPAVPGFAQQFLVPELSRILATRDSSASLRLMILEALPSSPVAAQLVAVLRLRVLDEEETLRNREYALRALHSSLATSDFVAFSRTLLPLPKIESKSLALTAMALVKFVQWDNEEIADTVVSLCKTPTLAVGEFDELERGLPTDRIAEFLDCLTERLPTSDDDVSVAFHRYEVRGAILELVARQLQEADSTSAEMLWRWLAPTAAWTSAKTSSQARLAEVLAINVEQRRALQHHVLLSGAEGTGISSGNHQLHRTGLLIAPTTAGDLSVLLAQVEPTHDGDARWKQLVQVALQNGIPIDDVLPLVSNFTTQDPDAVAWLDRFVQVPPAEVLARQSENLEQRQRKVTQAAEDFRNNCLAAADTIRAGTSDLLISLADRYLRPLAGPHRDWTARQRIESWVGQDVWEMATAGFHAYLFREPPLVTSSQVVDAIPAMKSFACCNITIAALLELRSSDANGLANVSVDQLKAAYFHLCAWTPTNPPEFPDFRQWLVDELRTRSVLRPAVCELVEPQLQQNRDSLTGVSSIFDDSRNEPWFVAQVTHWLTRYPAMPAPAEWQMLRELIMASALAELRLLLPSRAGVTGQQRQRWDAIGLLADFESTAARLSTASIDPNLLWQLRECTDPRFVRAPAPCMRPEQSAWVIRSFRRHWPYTALHQATLTGQASNGEATEYLSSLIQQLGIDAASVAPTLLSSLAADPSDGYTDLIRHAVAQQQRAHADRRSRALSLAELAAVTNGSPPATVADIRAVMMHALDQVQRKIRSDDVDSWRGFYETGNEIPKEEEDCRDYLMGLLRQVVQDIALAPESHVANDTRVDITCSRGSLRLPIEVKGQWHARVWTAAATQLLGYAMDHQADGQGIYLVLWFGENAHKPLQTRGSRLPKPHTPDEMKDLLSASIQNVAGTQLDIFVLDVRRP